MVVGCLVLPARLAAHPLGNFSISHYSALHIARDVINIRYVIDMAEIPTFQELQDTHIVPQDGHPSLPAYVAWRVETLRDGLVLEVNGRRLPLQTGASEVLFPPGAGGLPTLKLGVIYHAWLDESVGLRVNDLRYRDGNFPARSGWKEIVATTDASVSLLSSSVPEQDRSRQLADYPTDLLNSPPQDLEARVMFAGAAGARVEAQVQGRDAARLQVNQQATPRSAFTELMTAPQLSVSIVIVAAVVAVGLGAFHALEPGHGKTMVAAYLVGSRGTAWHALMLGLIVTGAHTAGVYLLGAMTLLASRYVVPERLYPWLGVLSGAIIVALGVSLFLRRYAGASGHRHPHDHHHAHDHHHHSHGHAHQYEHAHPHPHTSQPHTHPTTTVSLRDLLLLGVTGGIVPCPAALVVLLSAMSLGRVGFGLLLIVAFSVGLAAVLVAIGILMVYAQRLMSRFHGDGTLVTRWLPLTSAAMITVFGIVIAAQALVSVGFFTMPL
jgi:ABC-type nickel/cobalt efflux system permease component RcnA